MTNSPVKLNWQKQLSECITDAAELLAILKLPAILLPHAQQAATLFRLRVTRSFVDRMQKGNLNDPLLRQVLPLAEEFHQSNLYSTDPLAEADANKVPGLLQKYKNRVLLTISGACAINCRYCFRRHFPYADNNPGRDGWEQVFSYIEADKNINEVIYSGGDPLVANDQWLQWLTTQLSQIKHLQRVRIHTRLPIVLPERVTEDMLTWLTQTRLKPIVVIHCNHPQEINSDVTAGLHKLRSAKIDIFNQAVLLKGVNDDVETLVNLSEKLFACGVLPYYLHMMDKVKGAEHFTVSRARAQALYKELLVELPGYLVPKLVEEIAGEKSKIPLEL